MGAAIALCVAVLIWSRDAPIGRTDTRTANPDKHSQTAQTGGATEAPGHIAGAAVPSDQVGTSTIRIACGSGTR
jgi:hypothetical protein